MSAAGDAVSEQALFAARAFVARLERELGSVLPSGVRDQVLFAYEMGYLRGRSDGMAAAMRMFNNSKEGKDDDADSK